MTNPQRLLVLCEYPSLNGGERSLLAMLDELVPRGLDLRVAAPGRGPLAEALLARGWPHMALDLQAPPVVPASPVDDPDAPPAASLPAARLPLEECRRCLHAVISAARPQLIHANSLAMSRLSGPVAAELAVPSVGHLRDLLRVNRQVCADLNRHQRLLAVSQATHRWYIGQGLDPAKVQVLYNGVDLKRFRPRPATGYLHAELGLPPAAPLVAAIGQIGLRKGLDVCVAAASTVAAENSGVHFLIVGQRYSQKQESVEYEAGLRRLAGQPPLAGRCHFLGLRDDLPELLNELTLLVHAARQEPLGRVLLEAAAAGAPVIATDVGGTAEIFPRGAAAAELVPPGDADALAAAMSRLLGDSATRQALGRAARCRAEQCFDARRAAESLWTHYRQLGLGVGRG